MTLGIALVLLDVVRGAREALFMFFETLWALVLGFALSGAVQSFVPRRDLERRLGDHGPRAVVRAAGFGMASSSCSYAATSVAKALVRKGADLVSAIVFMIASTNLVVELGVVVLVLLGWQFLAAEFVGGPIMIVLLALVGGWVFRAELRARRRVAPLGGRGRDAEPTLRVRARSAAAWTDAARYAVADATMLRRELVLGYTAAGFLAVLVPARAWAALFLQGHGVWTTIENALVGPLVAVLSCVCSIGNVPLAAALWSGGISFGGVVAFLFADLIALPLILVYRRLFGTALALRMVAVLYVLMVTAGLATEGIFAALHAIPTRRALHETGASFEWWITIVLDVLAVALWAVTWWLARRRRVPEGGLVDPVCGMPLRADDAPVAVSRQGAPTVRFCSERCATTYAERQRAIEPSARP